MKWAINIYGRFYLSSDLNGYQTVAFRGDATTFDSKAKAEQAVAFLAQFHKVTAYKFEL